MSPVTDADLRDLRGDAPLYDAYLSVLAAPRTPFSIPGHKQRIDLIGEIVRGDIPLHGGMDTMKLEHGLLLEAERRRSRAVGRGHLPVLGGWVHARQPDPGAGRRRAR